MFQKWRQMSNRLDNNTLYQVTNIVLLSLPACSFNQGGSVIAAPGESPTDASKLGILDMPIAGKEYPSSTLVSCTRKDNTGLGLGRGYNG